MNALACSHTDNITKIWLMSRLTKICLYSGLTKQRLFSKLKMMKLFFRLKNMWIDTGCKAVFVLYGVICFINTGRKNV
ncbi:MAG: hypothetical protein Q8942_19885 [Bacillota bacterium]|nr:hypothetical protein [Bacillota bacterium]